MESVGPTPSTSGMKGATDGGSNDAQWADRIAETILKSLLQKAGEMDTSGLVGSAPSTADIENEIDYASKESQWAADRIAEQMAKRAKHRTIRGTPSPKLQDVTVYHIPSRLKALHPTDFKRDDMFLGLFINQEKFFTNNESFRLKLEVVDAFIAALNRQGDEAEIEAIPPRRAVDVGLADAPREANVIDIPEVQTKSLHKPAQNVHKGKNKKTTPTTKKTKKNDLKVVPRHNESSGGSLKWDWDRLRHSVVEHPEVALRHYAPTSYTVKNLEEVRSLLALDSVFLCMYLLAYLVQRKYTASRSLSSIRLRSHDFDVIFEKSPSLHNRILDDISKLQNQIPLDLIEQVLKILHSDADTLVEAHRKAICTGWINHHRDSLPGYRDGDAESLSNDLNNVEHLLACLCRLTQRRYLTRAPTRPLRVGFEIKDRLSKWLSKTLGLSIKEEEEGEDTFNVSLPTASKMKELGIYFQGHANGTSNLVPVLKHGFLNLSATLYIPRVSVVLNTEMLWRNMLVYLYESNTSQTMADGAHFMFFLMFMDNLIDTEKDVEVLREGAHPVIQKNLLGNNKQVAELFNTIISHQVVGKDSYTESPEWMQMLHRTDQFLKQRNRIRFLEFLRENFGTPVLIVSVIVALTIFVLSVLQTIYSALQYYSSLDSSPSPAPSSV